MVSSQRDNAALNVSDEAILTDHVKNIKKVTSGEKKEYINVQLSGED